MRRLPPLSGEGIRVRYRPRLSVRDHELHSGPAKGVAVHAASFLRKREIVLDSALRERPTELERIFLHELFHFAWVRMSNPARRSFEELVAREMECCARGELGWSAESRKGKLRLRDRAGRSRRWREYVCESFCDTGSWLFGSARSHEEFTLAPRFRKARKGWLLQHLEGRGMSI